MHTPDVTAVFELPDEAATQAAGASLAACLQPGGAAFIKDVEPGHPRATLGWWCDRYVSGDRGVSLVSMAALRALVDQALEVAGVEEIGLLAIDRPNYLVRIASPRVR